MVSHHKHADYKEHSTHCSTTNPWLHKQRKKFQNHLSLNGLNGEREEEEEEEEDKKKSFLCFISSHFEDIIEASKDQMKLQLSKLGMKH